jgi:transcriptional regulator with XRE-family HTH domain
VPHEIDTDTLSSLLRERRKRRGLNLRDAAAEIRELGGSMSASTLSRVEKGRVPDLEGFLLLCRWLGVPSTTFTSGGAVSADDDGTDELDTAERIAVHLRADRELDEESKDAIMTMIRLAYKAARSRGLPNELDPSVH